MIRVLYHPKNWRHTLNFHVTVTYLNNCGCTNSKKSWKSLNIIALKMFEENILANTFRSEGFLLSFSILCFLFSSPSNQSVSLHAKGSSVTRNSFSLKKEEFHDHFKQFLTKTIERLRLKFTAKGKHEYVPRDQVFPLLLVYCSLYHHKY